MKMDVPQSADRQAYYAQGASWSQEINHGLRRQRRLAWIVAGAAVSVAALEAVALAALAPLKTVTPYVVTVDRQTGYLDLAQALKPGVLSQDLAVTQSFLSQYVLARETFDVADLQRTYQQTTAWTAGPARDSYVRSMQRTNPQSPVVTNEPGTVVHVTIKGITVLSKSTALVRFDTDRTTGSGPAERRAYSSVIGFRYAGQPMRMEDRLTNPLGFQVTSYRRDGEGVEPGVSMGGAQ